MMKKRQGMRSSAILCVVMLAVCALLCMLPDRYQNESSRIPRERVRVEEVKNDALFPLGIVYSGVQSCRVTVLSGEHEGESVWASNYLNSALDKDKLFAPGDVAHAMVQDGEQGIAVTLIDHDRTGRRPHHAGAERAAAPLRRHHRIRRPGVAGGERHHRVEIADSAAD